MAKKSYSNDRTMQNEWFSFVASTALIFFSHIFAFLLWHALLAHIWQDPLWRHRNQATFDNAAIIVRPQTRCPVDNMNLFFFYGGDTIFEIKPWTVLHHFYLELFNMFDIYFNTNHHRYHLIFWLYHREDHQSVFVLIALASLDEYSCVSS